MANIYYAKQIAESIPGIIDDIDDLEFSCGLNLAFIINKLIKLTVLNSN